MTAYHVEWAVGSGLYAALAGMLVALAGASAPVVAVVVVLVAVAQVVPFARRRGRDKRDGRAASEDEIRGFRTHLIVMGLASLSIALSRGAVPGTVLFLVAIAAAAIERYRPLSGRRTVGAGAARR
ncbi:hypothetical protein ACVU7I_02260 [Patulibacter sp. S7RM1-6]